VVEGSVGVAGEPLLPAVPPRRAGGNRSRTARQPTRVGTLVPRLRPRRPDPDRDHAPDSVALEMSGGPTASRLDGDRLLVRPLAAEQFRPLAGQTQIPVGRQAL